MSKVTVHHGRAGRRPRPLQRRLASTGIVTILAMLLSLFPQVAGLPVPTASAHNLDSGFVYMFFDPATQAAFDAFIASNPPGTPLLQDDQTVGIIIKVVPSDGTNTGVGGYVDFYVPNGVQVTDVAYLTPNGSGGYDKAPMKGQSPIAVGDGPIGTNCTAALGTPPPLTLGPNIIGTTAQAVATTTGCHNGTIAGVYADTGIFFSTDPRTAHGSYSGGALKNNSGDTVGLRTYIGTVPNLWDAQQLAAYGIAGSANPAFPTAPIVDPNGRGNAPWGNANAVAGPQSGYAWEFDMGVCGTTANPCDAAEMKTASSRVGPWQRVQYPGSQISKDQPGLKSTLLGYAGVDGSKVGYPLASFGGGSTSLPATTSQLDTTSPKTIRWAIGQLTYLKPEYVWVQFKVIDRTKLATANGGACPIFYGDTFGGDAGGTDSGKDHIWRYYDPNGVQWNACLGGGKPDNVPAVKVGDIYQYKVKVYNYGLTPLSNVVVSDLLPSGVAFISAVPAQNLGPNPLKWTVGAIPVGGKFEATITVRATGTGVLTNALLITSEQGSQTIYEQTPSGAIPILTQTKSVSPTAVAPGATVTYTIVSKNIGTGPTASPVKITEYLPAGFTYTGLTSVTANGASYTGTTVVNQTNPNQPIFTVPTGIQAGKELRLVFTAAASATAGVYCNSYQLLEGSTPYTTGTLACLDVGAGAIGDTLFRDWDGDGIRDPEDEGLPGVVMELRNGTCTPGVNCPTATTDANGVYQFIGLTAGSYTVAVTSGVPAGYTLTYDPEGGADGRATVTLATNEKRLDLDFGYRPGGAGSIGDMVFDDHGNDGIFNGADVGIPGVVVNLYEDTNGNGMVDAGDALIGAQTTSNGAQDVDGDGNVDPVGYYRFRNLAEGLSYIADVDQADPDLVAHFGAASFRASTVDPRPVQGLSGAYTAADFGFYEVVPGSIGDQVFYDLDADGVYDSGEPGLAYVDVKLYQDTNGNGVVDVGEPLLGTTTTDASGAYSFNNLPPGTYVVDVIATDPDIPASLSASRDPIAVTLGTAEHKTDVDFPFVQGLTKTVNKAGALPGEQLTYDIYPRYFGAKLLTGVSINDTIPVGTTYVAVPPSITAGGEAVDDDDPADGIIDRVAWDLGSNSPGSVGYSGGTALCPATQTIVADKDTYIDSNDINANYGSETTISVDSDKVFNGLVQFTTLPTLPAGAVLDRAELLLTVNSGQGVNRTVSIRKLLKGPWTEGTSSGNCTTGAAWQGPNCTDDWLSAGGNFGSSDYGPQLGATIAPATSGATYATVVTSAVTDWYSVPSANYGLVLLATGSDTGEVKFVSRTGAAGSQPRLKLTYRVPTAGGCSGTVSLADVADTYIQQDSGGNDNYGTATTLQALPAATKQKHALLRFDVDGIPVGAILTAATLKVNVTTAKAGVVSEIHRMTTAWAEGVDAATGATWLDANGTGTAGTWANVAGFGTADFNGTVAGSITPGTTGTKTADVKTLVQGWQTGAFTNNGLVLLSTGTQTRAAAYASREDSSTPSKDPVIEVSWVIPPADPTGVSTLSAGPLLVVEGDKITVKMVLENRTATAVTGVTPGSLTVTAGGSGAYSCATLAGPTPANQTVPANGAATFTWTCTTGTAPTLPGTLTFSATASGDATTWASASSESVIVSPPLEFKAAVNNPVSVSVAINQAVMDLAFPATQGTVCYVMADGYGANDVDYLRQVDRLTGVVTPATPAAAGTQSIEAMAWSLDFLRLYAANANQLGTLDTATGLFTARANTIASTADPLQGEFGAISAADVDGISFDPITGALYGVHRRETTTPSTLLDVLIKIDPVTGKHINNAFGASVDYIKIDASALAVYDVDDISFDPVSGALYAIANGTAASFSTGDRLVTINKATGAVTDIARITNAAGGANIDDMEGLSFYGDGALFATTGYHATAADANKLWYLDKSTAVATERAVLGTQLTYNDYEAVACQGGSLSTSTTPSNEVETALTASIGDRVWADLDGNGSQDPGEPGLAGVTVCATPTAGGTPVCHVTDAFGGYQIYGLTNGVSYNVTVTPGTFPAGYIPSTATTLTVTATTAGTLTADFGLRPPGTASIGDTVWLDADNDGSLNGAEAGLPNVTVQLYIDRNNDGLVDGGDTLIQTTTTDPNGVYLFAGLHPDDYLVVVDETSAVTSPYGGAPTLATGMDPTTGTANPRDVTITTAGQAITDADFGYNWAGSIGDYVWWDADTQGDQDEGVPVVGAVVLLYVDADGNGLLEPWNGDYQIGIDFTDASGGYRFDNLPPGNYLVDVYEDSLVTGGVRDIVPTTPDVRAVSLAAGQAVTTADFGYYQGARVEGNVFHDADRNGIFDTGEAGLAPVTVTLTGTDMFGAPITKTVETDASGHFVFIVPEGNYTLTYDTPDVAAIDPSLGDRTTPVTYTFHAYPGEDWHPSFDFGVDNTGAIGDTVWNDVDGNQSQNGGEPGLAGVTVNLIKDVNNDNLWDPDGVDNIAGNADDEVILATQATDANGKYLFAGLADGNYVVVVNAATLPTNFNPTYDNSGSPDGVGQADISGGNQNPLVDFGYKYSPPIGTNVSTLAGYVWEDLDGNGAINVGETPIPGVQVTIACAGYGTFILTTTSSTIGGNYSLPNVPDGLSCTITVNPATLPSTAYGQTGDPDSVINHQTTVTSGPGLPLQNFGYQEQLGSISGTVCVGSGDGLCNAGEPGIAFVPVALTWLGPDGILGTGDDTTTTQNTDASGNYNFQGLQPGQYRAVETNLPGYISLADADGSTPDSISPIVLPLGGAVTDRDFEDTRLASVSGTVFNDLNLDGNRDPGEPAIANVPVTLRDSAGVAITTVNTDALGYYEFTSLQPGSYRITEANLATWISTGDADGAANTTDRIDVTLAAGDTKTQQNFGDVLPGSIAGTVFNDANNNGVQDGGELGIPGVQVCAATGLCATTAADGTYLIPNVPPGSYTVTETNPAGYLSTTPDALPVSVGSGQNVTHVNYGDELPVANTYSISGTVCENTLNNNGVCDSGEKPLPGVTVKLYNSAGAVIATTATDASGNYIFVNVPNGNYWVGETDPLLYVSVNDADGGTDNTVAVTVAGANVIDKDFVDTPQPSALKGTVYEDLNLNGQRDAGEPGIPGVTVKLNTGATTTTDANGDYAFTNLAPATYTITETDLPGYLSTGDVDGANDNTIVAAVPAGVTVTGRDFGDVKLGSINGVVWNDLNSNGILDAGEPGIQGVSVCAVPTGAGLPLCAVTDANGSYTIPNVPPGGYVVTETDPAGMVSTTPNTVPVTVPSGGTATVNYGDVAPNPALGSISGTVCVNVDGNDICDPNEAPLAGVTVELWLVGGGSPLQTTTTDANGDYAFQNLPAGSYRVEEVNPANYTSVNDADGTGNGADAIFPISVSGNAVVGQDFIDTPAPGTISGKVCDDLNRSGVCDSGEAGIDGVTVKLYDSGGTLVGAQTTANGGLYSFPNLPPDTYTVVETDPANYGSTGDVYGANDNTIVVPLPAGGAVPGQNFADAPIPGAITGVVYSDLNSSGGYNPGEPGLANVQVCLTPPVQACQTTNAGGQYAFLNLPPGAYTVTETDPAGYVSTGDVDGVNDNTIAVTVPAGVTVLDRNFFDHENAIIGVAKRLVGQPVNNGNGTYDVTYEILVKNMGTVTLSQVQATDNLATTFAGATGFNVQSKAATGLTINPAYTGNTPNINLLTGVDSLVPGASGTITLVVRVTPGSNLGPYNNQVTGTGTSPAGAKPVDLSQDGTDPDPDHNGDPTDNNDPTPVSFAENPVIGVAKRVSLVTDNGDGTQTVTYILNLENLGDVTLINVQVIDDLEATFAGATGFNVVSISTSANLNKNPGYTGRVPDWGLLLGTDTLAVGATGTITLVVKVTPGSKLGPYNNQVTASADSQSGGITQDLSDDGTDPDFDGDGNPNEAGENDPTPVTFTAKTQIGAAKVLTAVVNNGDGTYDVTYSIVVENLGSTVLTNVQASDNLVTTFPAPSIFNVVSVATSAGLHKNTGYTGISPNTGLLMGTDTLNPGGVETITLVVRVTPRTNLGPHNNQVRATATGPGSVPTADNSDDGTDPDPDGDGNPNENGENDPTPVTFAEAPAIGIAKAVQSQTNNGDGTFTVVYAINVKNLGDIVLNNVQVTDNLATTFAAATSWTAMITSVSTGWTANPSYTGSTPNLSLLTATGNSLAVGATKTIVLTVTVKPAANPATYNNQATATGVSPAGATVTDLSDDGTAIDPDGDKNANEPGENDPTPVTFTQTTGIALVKTGPAASYVGETITYTYTVTNTGNVALSDVAVSDDKCSPPVGPLAGGDADGDNKLDVTETWQFTCTYTVLANDPNPLVNHATAQGASPLGGQPVVSPQVSWSVPLVTFLIGDTVWLDDGDGVQEPGETTGLYNVPITITGTDSNGNPVNFTVYTDINGHYVANFPRPGTYTATAPAGFGGYTHSSPISLGFTLTPANPQRLDIDFGYVLPTGIHFLGLQTVPGDTRIQLNWQVTPVDGSGLPRFHVWRSVPDGAWKRVTVALLEPVSSAGDVLEYSYVDTAVETGVTYLYRLETEDGVLIGPWQVKASIARHFFYLPFMRR